MQEAVAALLEQQTQCVLATRSDHEQALHLMAYAYSQTFDQIYLTSLKHTQKVHNMQTFNKVTLLWDNRTGNTLDHSHGFAMSGFGEARELSGHSAETISALLLQRNNSLKALLENIDAVIFAIDIDRYQWVEGYTRIVTFTPEKHP